MTTKRQGTVPHDEAIGLGGSAFYFFDVERGKIHEFVRTLFSFDPEYPEGRHPPMFPTQPVVAGYLWGYMLEDPQDTGLARVDINPHMSLDAEQKFVFPQGVVRLSPGGRHGSVHSYQRGLGSTTSGSRPAAGWVPSPSTAPARTSPTRAARLWRRTTRHRSCQAMCSRATSPSLIAPLPGDKRAVFDQGETREQFIAIGCAS